MPHPIAPIRAPASINTHKHAIVQNAEEQEEDTSLRNSNVTTKYTEAAKISNFALQAVIDAVNTKRLVHSTPVASHSLAVRPWSPYLGSLQARRPNNR